MLFLNTNEFEEHYICLYNKLSNTIIKIVPYIENGYFFFDIVYESNSTFIHNISRENSIEILQDLQNINYNDKL